MNDDPIPSRSRNLSSWLLILRTFAYPASLSAVLLGTALAISQGHAMRWDRFLAALVGVLLFHTAANLFNDGYDFERGLDRHVRPMSGGVVRGWLSPRQAKTAAWLCLALGAVLGFWLTAVAGWPVLALGIIGTALALGYTGPKFCLKYAGLGDLTIFLAFGFLPVMGSYFIQTGRMALAPLFWTLPMVSFTVAILHANNWIDIATDPELGCTTVAGLLGDKKSGNYYALLMVGPFALMALYQLIGWTLWPPLRAPWTVFLTLPMLFRVLPLVRIGQQKDKAFNRLDGLTGQVQLGFGLLLAVGFVLGRWIG